MIQIRALKKDDDFSGLLTLSRQFFQEYEAHHADFFKIDHLKDENILSYFLSFCEQSASPCEQSSAFCEQDSRLALIAVEAGRIVGNATCYIKEQADYWQVKRVGEVSGLMVQEEYRSKGVGGMLLKQAEGFFKAAGVRYFTLYTAVENTGAIEFYKKHGMNPLYTTMIGEV